MTKLRQLELKLEEITMAIKITTGLRRGALVIRKGEIEKELARVKGKS